jgi:hypothetical protein
MALAVAGTFACGGAFAGGMHHGAKHGSVQSSSVEAITPSSPNESAPWLANTPHSAGWTSTGSTRTVLGMDDSLVVDSYVGASSSIGASGSGGFDSMSSGSLGYDSSIYGLDTSLGDTAYVEYWLLGDESPGTGTSSGTSGSGYGGFDSMSYSDDSMSFSDQSFESLAAEDSGSTEQYLVWGPLVQADASDLILVEADPEIAADLTQAALSEGFTVLTPIYDEMADASAFGDSGFEVSQYSPLSGDEDLAT